MDKIIVTKVENNFTVDGIKFEGICINDKIKIGMERIPKCCENVSLIKFKFNEKLTKFKDLNILNKTIYCVYYHKQELSFKMIMEGELLDVFIDNDNKNCILKLCFDFPFPVKAITSYGSIKR